MNCEHVYVFIIGIKLYLVFTQEQLTNNYSFKI